MCREHNCKKRLVILNEGEGPFIFKDRRKKARVRVKLRKNNKYIMKNELHVRSVASVTEERTRHAARVCLGDL